MTEKETKQMAQGRATPGVESAAVERTTPPSKAGEEYRKEWAEANGKDPSEMREIHHPDGYVDRFDGRGWVLEEGS